MSRVSCCTEANCTEANLFPLFAVQLLGAFLALGVLSGLSPSPASAGGVPSPPSAYALDLVSTAATGVAMNAAGDVVGTRTVDPGCNPCLGITQVVAWRSGVAIELPAPPGFSALEVRSINAQGWIAGNASPSFPGIGTHAVIWKPMGNGYEVVDLGVLPGKTVSTVAGIDDLGRVVGTSATEFFPPVSAPFLWTEAGGMIDLTTLGFPAEGPMAISPAGTVALSNSWYLLDDPGSVTPLVSPPQGFFPPGGNPVAINDAGDQARFLSATSGENLAYLFRYHHEGSWQQLSTLGSGHLAPWGIGSINQAGDVTATIVGSAVVAYGPDGLAEGLGLRLAPVYGDAVVTSGGQIADSGEILAKVIVGRSPRLVRLVAAEPCQSGCSAVPLLLMRGKFIEDPGAPGQCTPKARDLVGAALRVLDEAGRPVTGASVHGVFLDDYWLEERVSAITDSRGVVRFRHDGPACVGAVAFLLTAVDAPGRTLDRTSGELADYVIPLP